MLRLPLTVIVLIAALLGVLLTAAAAPAPAEAKAPKSWERKALRVAHGYWQKKRPRANCKRRQVRIKSMGRLSGGAWGRAPIGVCRQRRGRGKATIKMVRHADRYGWRTYCTLIVHEWGHLVGLDHTRRPNRLMSAIITTRALLRGCGRAPR